MVLKFALFSTALCMVSPAAVRSGKAETDWLSSAATFEAGKPVQTAIRLVLDEGWHTYWLNPGEGGMKISVIWELPTGWTAGALEHPVPKRFMTGELPGFGYEGTVVFPVAFTPPAGFAGEAKLKGKISWLACNDDQCLPGKAELELSLVAGLAKPAEDAAIIDGAMRKIPRPNPEIALEVIEKAGTLVLSLASETTKPFNPDDYEIFPASPQAVDSAAQFVFRKEANSWQGEVPKSEYLNKPLQDLALVFAGKNGQPPMLLTWSAKGSKRN